MITRTLTDLLWSFESVRKWVKGEIKNVYYSVLAFIVVWIMVAFVMTQIFKIQPLIWILLVANMSNLVLGVTALCTIALNYTIMPKEVRAPIWAIIVLIIGAAFWLTFMTLMILNTFFGVKI